MNNEAKTMTSGQALQLVAVIAQSLGKIGLGFDEVNLLIDKPSIARKRLRALAAEKPAQVVPQHQYATIERLEVRSNYGHRHEDVGEFLILGRELKEALKDSEKFVDEYGSRGVKRLVHRCDVIRSISEESGSLYPVFRELLDYHGRDKYIWDKLHERDALWTVDDVMGFIRDEIHEGKDPLGLKEARESAVFPVILTEKRNELFQSRMDPDRIGFLFVSKDSLLRQRPVWRMNISEGEHVLNDIRKLIYFANDPRPPAKK